MTLFTRILFAFTLLSASSTYAQQTYYVSASGNDSNQGTSESSAWQTLAKVNRTNFKPGDKILLRKGNSWQEELRPNSNGSSGKLITFGAYGSGNKPVVRPSSGAYAINIREKSYIKIDGLHVITPPSGNGIAIRGKSVDNEVTNCRVEGGENAGKGIVFSSLLNGNIASRSKVTNNEVFKVAYGISGSYGMSGGGLVENNYIHDIRDGGGDGIVARRGNYNGLIIRENEITGWRDDAIDLFGGNNIIVEYNHIHHVAAKVNTAGNGIKSGGSNTVSSDTKIRYNTIYGLRGSSGGSKDGIITNGGDDSEIYGNLVYDVDGKAISVPKESKNINIYHNTLISINNTALFVDKTSNVSASNNILWGSKGALNINMKILGKNNLFIGGINDSNYAGSGDISAPASSVFADPSKGDYQLKSGSPAIDKGTKISGYTSTIRKRSIIGNPDIGVFEYGGATASPPAASLSVSAGSDITITLPADRASFQAQTSGTNGASVSYRWTRQSGPSATLNNTTSSQLDLLDAREGTYVLSVTASANGSTSSDEVRLVVKPAQDDEPSSPPPPGNPTPAPPTSSNGLRYKYYEGSWSSLPDFGSQSVRKEGTVSNFDVGVRRRDSDFGLVFTGSIDIQSSGQYTFYTKSDDGSKLFIDGKLVVGNDGLHATREQSGKITLSKGRHSIEVQFFERSGEQVLEALYAGPGISKRQIPNGVLYPDGSTPPSSPDPEPEPTPKPEPKPDPTPPAPPTAQNGLRYKYYEGRWSELPNFSSLAVVKSGTLPNFSLSPARTDRYFGFVYTGYIKVEQSGSYTFYTTSDDGSKLYINGKQIVDNDRVHAALERSGSVNLSAGYHQIEVRFFENAYGEELGVRYQGPGVGKQTVPDNVLFLDSPGNARTVSSTTKKTGLNAAAGTSQPLDLDMTPINVYPVPFKDQLTVNLGEAFSEQTVRVALIDHLGRMVLERSVRPSQSQMLVLDLSKLVLSKGMYHVTVTAEGQQSHSFKVIKE